MAKTGKKQVKGIGRGNHPNTQKGRERTQFKPGESGNPDGKPPGTKDRSTILKRWLEVKTEVSNPATTEFEQGTIEDEVMLALIEKAKTGDVSAIREIQDTMYGKVKEQHEVTGENGGPVVLKVIYEHKGTDSKAT